MKWVKRFGIVMLSLPIVLAIVYVLYEIFGMYINHITTKEQTNTLRTNLESEISESEEKEKIFCPVSYFQQKCGKLK